jgi:peroxiredoxin (alkyl hydroperoxide reductase subunit C)
MIRPGALLAVGLACLLTAFSASPAAFGASEQFKGQILDAGKLKPIDSQTTLKVGDMAPDFSLPTIDGGTVSLGQFRTNGTTGAPGKNVVISFVPAAFTPVCSEQWPGYNVVKEYFEKADTTLIGITTDNVHSLHAWTAQMGGVWFPVASDFWPHGETAEKYGVLRSTGTSERALFVIDREGIIRYMDVHDINDRPDLELLVAEVQKLAPGKRE